MKAAFVRPCSMVLSSRAAPKPAVRRPRRTPRAASPPWSAVEARTDFHTKWRRAAADSLDEQRTAGTRLEPSAEWDYTIIYTLHVQFRFHSVS